MPYATVNQYTGHVAIPEIFESGYNSIVFRNPYLSLFTPETPPAGDKFLYRVNVTGHTAEIFTEGQVSPAPTSSAVVIASASYVYGRVITKISGMLMDALQGLPGEMFNIIDENFSDAAMDTADILSTTFLSTSAPAGLLLAVDSAGTYFGINRSTYAGWGSDEQAGGGAAITMAMIQASLQAIRDNERGYRGPKIMWAPENQGTRIVNLVGVPGAANAAYRTTYENGLTLQPDMDQVQINASTKLVTLPDLTDTEVVITPAGEIKMVLRRGLQVKLIQPGEDDTYQISMGMLQVVKRPHLCSKITNLLA